MCRGSRKAGVAGAKRAGQEEGGGLEVRVREEANPGRPLRGATLTPGRWGPWEGFEQRRHRSEMKSGSGGGEGLGTPPQRTAFPARTLGSRRV